MDFTQEPGPERNAANRRIWVKKSLKLPRSSQSTDPPRSRSVLSGPGSCVKSIPLFSSAERVVLGALLGVAQYLVGFVDLLEALGGLAPLAGGWSRVMLPRELR